MKTLHLGAAAALHVAFFAAGCITGDDTLTEEEEEEVAASTPTIIAAEIPSGYTKVFAVNKGVKCNGTADDTAALQSALNGLQSNQALVLPVGTCVTSKRLLMMGKTKVAVVGQGMNRTIIRATNPASSAFMINRSSTQGMDTVLIADFQVYSPNSTKRGTLPEHDCFAFLGAPRNLTVDRVKARGCMAAGMLLARGNNVLIQNSVVERSRADAYHIAYGSQNVTVQFNQAIAPGDDMYASIGYSSINRNINFLDNVGSGGGHAGGVHFDGTVGAKAYRNRISNTGASCFAVSADAVWGSSNNSDYIDFQNNYGSNCVTRSELDHGGIMVYTWQSDWNIGPHITFTNNTIDSVGSRIGFKAQAFNGSVNVTATDNKFSNVNKCFALIGNSTVVRSGNTLNGSACN